MQRVVGAFANPRLLKIVHLQAAVSASRRVIPLVRCSVDSGRRAGNFSNGPPTADQSVQSPRPRFSAVEFLALRRSNGPLSLAAAIMFIVRKRVLLQVPQGTADAN